MRNFLDGIDEKADHTQDGWNRNISTLSWLPFFAFAVLLVYFVRGNRMTETTREHVIRAVNLSVTAALAFFAYYVLAIISNGVGNEVAFDGSSRGGSPVWGFFLFLFFTVVMVLLGLFLDARSATSPLRWGMIGIWLVFCLIVVFNADSAAVGTAFAYVFLFVVLVTNIFRGRIGLRPSTLGIPIVPLFSER